MGEAIARVGVGEPLVIALVGPLGAGKTDWVKGLAEGLGIDSRSVASPTFVIASEYSGRHGLAHVDLYRLESGAELEEVGFRDLLTAGAIVAVEWADRFPALLPTDHIEVTIRRARCGAADDREIEIRATGPETEQVVRAWRRLLEEQNAGAVAAPAARE